MKADQNPVRVHGPLNNPYDLETNGGSGAPVLARLAGVGVAAAFTTWIGASGVAYAETDDPPDLSWGGELAFGGSPDLFEPSDPLGSTAPDAFAGSGWADPADFLDSMTYGPADTTIDTLDGGASLLPTTDLDAAGSVLPDLPTDALVVEDAFLGAPIAAGPGDQQHVELLPTETGPAETQPVDDEQLPGDEAGTLESTDSATTVPGEQVASDPIVTEPEPADAGGPVDGATPTATDGPARWVDPSEFLDSTTYGSADTRIDTLDGGEVLPPTAVDDAGSVLIEPPGATPAVVGAEVSQPAEVPPVEMQPADDEQVESRSAPIDGLEVPDDDTGTPETGPATAGLDAAPVPTTPTVPSDPVPSDPASDGSEVSGE
ncbi:MAG: hypothetical protein H7Y15_16370, partial [Pseudonocardia sp.]|nr:hypothetical protein [Pseudonocardia sp.]